MNTFSLRKTACFFAKRRFQTRKTARILDFLSVRRLGVECLQTMTEWTCAIDGLGTWRSWSETKRHISTEVPQKNEVKDRNLCCSEKTSKCFFAKDMVYHWHRPIFWRPGDLSWILGSQICLSESIRAQRQPRWCAILRVAWPVDTSIRRFFRVETCRKLEVWDVWDVWVGLVDAQLLLKRLGHSHLPRLVLSEHLTNSKAQSEIWKHSMWKWPKQEKSPTIYDATSISLAWEQRILLRLNRGCFTWPRHFGNSHGEHTQLSHDLHPRVLLLAPTECWLVADSFTKCPRPCLKNFANTYGTLKLYLVECSDKRFTPPEHQSMTTVP